MYINNEEVKDTMNIENVQIFNVQSSFADESL